MTSNEERRAALLIEMKFRRQAEEDLYTFVQLAWHIVEPGAKFQGGFALKAICEHLEEVYYGRIKRLLINQPPRTGKALDSATPILTINGWKCHGDLIVGDFVYSPNGIPVKIIAVTEEFEDECYEIGFDDGSKIIAAKDHLWLIDDDILDKKRWNRKRVSKIVSTKDLVDKISNGNRHNRNPRIKISKALITPKQYLIIDPYIMGCWIGDGTTSCGSISVGHQDIDHFKNYGRTTKVRVADDVNNDYWRVTPEGLSVKLRARGLLFQEKNIPEEYLSASVEQRIELLQGLMDTDGTAAVNGECSFTSKYINLASQFLLLVRSLGIKARIHSGKYCKLNGKLHGPYYNISFYPDVDFPIFKLQRKQARVKRSLNVRILHRYINSVKLIEKRKVNCIQVDGNMYVAGREFIPTHNSSLISVLFPVWVWIKNPTEQFMCVSYVESLAKRDNVKARRLIKSQWFQTRWPTLQLTDDQDTKNYVENTQGGHRYVTGCDGSVTGFGANIIICDDLNSVRDSSDTALDSAQSFFTDVLPTRFNDFKTGKMIVVQQRTDMKDISGWILANQKKEFVALILPMEFEESRKCVTVPIKSTAGVPWQDPRKIDGELLWPERFGPKELKQLKSALSSEYAISGQLQQRPAPTEGGMIKRAWWQPWKEESPPNIRFTIQAWDTAMSIKDKAAYSACLTFGIFKDDHQHDSLILLSAWRKRVEFPELYKAVQRMAKDYRATTEERPINPKYAPDLILVEEKASGVQLIQTLNKTGITLVGWRPDKYGDKMERVRRVTHLLEAGRVYVPYKPPNFTRPMQYADFLINQCAVWPKGDGHDLVDVLSCILQRVINSGWVLHPMEYEAEQQVEWKREYMGQEEKGFY